MGKLSIPCNNDESRITRYCSHGSNLLNQTLRKCLRNCNLLEVSCDRSEGYLPELSLRRRIICCQTESGMFRTTPPRVDLISEDGALSKTIYQFQADGDQNCEPRDCIGNRFEVIDIGRVTYRAEGNANLVLSITDTRQVLRLKKADVKEQINTDTIVDLERFIKYYRMMRIFFSQQFVPEPKLARLGVYDLDGFNKQLTKFRPVNRLKKEVKQREGILYPDVAFLPAELQQRQHLYYGQHDRTNAYNTYCVEIKPKQGWSFSEQCYEDNFISLEMLVPEISGTAPGKCRFCLYQYLKLQKKSTTKVSKYCPLDLFSGKPIRMLHAIKGLIGAPQNNFRLSKNGRIMYDESREKSVFNRILKEIFQRDGRSKEERKTIFMNLIKEILLKDFSAQTGPEDRKLLTIRKDRKKKDKNLIHSRMCNPINHLFLPKNCVLKQILDVQLLVKSSLSDASKCHNQGCVSVTNQNALSYVDELYEKYLDCIDQIRCSNTIESDCDDRSTAQSNPECGWSNNFTNFYLSSEERYQLGATALDCSIMITFRRLSEREEDRLSPAARSHIVSIENVRFLVNVTITDLDAKSPNHHRKYVDQLRDSVYAYRDFMSRLKR